MAVAGRVDGAVLHSLLLAVPGTALGAWCGARLYRKASAATFRRVVLALLLLSGAMLVAQSLRSRLGFPHSAKEQNDASPRRVSLRRHRGALRTRACSGGNRAACLSSQLLPHARIDARPALPGQGDRHTSRCPG